MADYLILIIGIAVVFPLGKWCLKKQLLLIQWNGGIVV